MDEQVLVEKGIWFFMEGSMMWLRHDLGVRLLWAAVMLSTCVPEAFAQIELPDMSPKYELGGWTQDVASAAVTLIHKFAPANFSNSVAALGRAGGCLQQAGVVTAGVYVSRQDRRAVGILILASKTKANWGVLIGCGVSGIIGGGPADAFSPCWDQGDYRTQRDEYRHFYWASRQSVCTDLRVALSGVPTNTPSVQQSPIQAGPAFVAGVWTGTYICPQGAVPFRLTVSQGTGGSVQAQFDFSAPNGQVGAFALAGRLSGGMISLAPTRWIAFIPAYQMIGLEGSLSADQRMISGRITNPQCGAFTLTRVQ